MPKAPSEGGEEQPDRIRWAPRLPPRLLERLYESDASGRPDLRGAVEGHQSLSPSELQLVHDRQRLPGEPSESLRPHGTSDRRVRELPSTLPCRQIVRSQDPPDRFIDPQLPSTREDALTRQVRRLEAPRGEQDRGRPIPGSALGHRPGWQGALASGCIADHPPPRRGPGSEG